MIARMNVCALLFTKVLPTQVGEYKSFLLHNAYKKNGRCTLRTTTTSTHQIHSSPLNKMPKTLNNRKTHKSLSERDLDSHFDNSHVMSKRKWDTA